MMKYLNSNQHARRGRVRSRTASLLAAATTFVGATAIGALPVQAVAPTFDISPNPSTTLEIDMPWVDRVHYTIDISEDQDFWLYLDITLVAGNGPVLTRLSSSLLDEDNRFYIEDHDADAGPYGTNWGGLYLQPVNASLVDDGQTEWVLAGTLNAWSVSKGPYLYAGTQSGITDRDSADLARKSLSVQAMQSQIYMSAISAEVGRDLSSVEVTYDQDLLAEDVSFGDSQYSATPQLTDVSVRPSSSSFSGSNPESVEIDGRKLIARFDTPFAVGDLGSQVIDINNSSGYGPYDGSLHGASPAVYGLAVDAPSTTPPALDTDTPPVVAAAGTTLTLTFDYPITSATPATSTLTVTAGGSAVAVSSIANSGATSVLTLASAIGQDATVKVSYDAPSSGGYQDAAGNLVADFTDIAVTNSSTATATTTTTAPTTTAPATTVPATENTTPSLVTEENQDALTAAAGSAKLIVNGEEVEMTLSSTGANDAGATAPEDRTEAQITELQDAADGIVERLDTAAGGDSGLTVVDTDTGAEIDGIFDDTRVPVEDVIVAESTQFSGLYASRDEDGNPNKIRAEVLEMERGGEVAVFVYGLPAGESAELVLMSTPYLLGTATADSSGNFSKVLSPPEAILAGTHTLVTASETLSVSLGIKITEPAADVTLPATGGGDFSTTPVLLVVLVGAFFLVLARRRENAEN